jgi:hypothetical protein
MPLMKFDAAKMKSLLKETLADNILRLRKWRNAVDKRVHLAEISIKND